MGKALVDGVLIDTPNLTPEQQAAGAARKKQREAAEPKRVDGLTFLARFTAAEYAAVILAAQQTLAAGNAQLSLWVDMLRVNGAIDLNGEAAQAAKARLVEAGLLTRERAELIFA